MSLVLNNNKKSYTEIFLLHLVKYMLKCHIHVFLSKFNSTFIHLPVTLNLFAFCRMPACFSSPDRWSLLNRFQIMLSSERFSLSDFLSDKSLGLLFSRPHKESKNLCSLKPANYRHPAKEFRFQKLWD